jgi:tetrahydrodipicolinate N-succinyltransferase
LIGSRVYIGPGVTIGDGAVVHAGSLVTKDIGPLEIWAGMPARRVGHRTKNVSEAELARTKKLIEEFGLGRDRHMEELRPSAQKPPTADASEDTPDSGAPDGGVS